MQRYKATIEYDGTDFCGWQRQDASISVQQVLEESIYKFKKIKTCVYGSGRTDAGVHALGQVAHFDLDKEYDLEEVICAINHHSKPHRVALVNCEYVPPDFHARFSATERSYLYRIINRLNPVIIEKNRVWQVRKSLDFGSMKEASVHFMGNHDFTSFRSSHCQAKSPVRTINNIEIRQDGEEIQLCIRAQSFLHHMVRNIVGTLVDVGLGKISPLKIKEIIDKKSRIAAGVTAPACGLYFMKAKY